MDITELTYTKGTAWKEVEEVPFSASQIVVEEHFSGSAEMSVPDYQKPMPEIDPPRLFIISGGTNRESDYLKFARNLAASKHIVLAITSKKGQGLQPFQMSQWADQFYLNHRFETKEQDYELVDSDHIFMISDVDEYGSDLTRRIPDNPERLKWIVSNPCFEIWLFYHYFECPLPLLEEGLSLPVSKRSQWMKQRLHELHQVDSAKALLNMQIAIKNTEANFKMGENGLPDVYATQMYLFAQALLDAVTKDEFEAMVRHHRERADAYRAALL